MTEKEILSSTRRIHDLLSVKRLKEAMTDLRPMLITSGVNSWIEELEQIDSTYQVMLEYTVKGIQDPERQKVYRKIVAGLYELNDRVSEYLLTKMSTQYVHVRKRIFRDDPGLESFIQSFLSEPDRITPSDPEYLRDLSRLFHMIWLSDEFHDREVQLVEKVKFSATLTVPEKAILVTALNFSVLRYFDKRKFELLFEFFDSTDEELRQRALIGLMLAFYRYDARLVYYPAIRGRFLLMDEYPNFKKMVQEVIMQLIRGRNTDQLSKRMQEEILPEMLKLSPQIRNKLDLDLLMGESLSDEENPEWKEIFDDDIYDDDEKSDFIQLMQDKLEGDEVLAEDGDEYFIKRVQILKDFIKQLKK